MDPLMGRTQEPISLNKYLYASSSPASRIDPSGLEDMASLSVGIAISGIFATMSGCSRVDKGSLMGPMVTNFEVHQGPQQPTDQFMNVIFDLDLAGSESDIVIGQKMKGWSQGAADATRVDVPVSDDPRPGALWWDGSQWSGAEGPMGPNHWGGAAGSRYVRFYDYPGWLVPATEGYRAMQFHFRTYVAPKSNPNSILRHVDWFMSIWFSSSPGFKSFPDRYFSAEPFLE